jgi:hypothetical protein
MTPRQRAPWRGPWGPTGSLGLKRNDLEGEDRCDEVEAMASMAVGRRGASGLWPGKDLALVGGLHTHGVRGCVCVLKSTGVRTGGERAWVCGAHSGRRQSVLAARLGGHGRRGSACAFVRKGVRA